MLAPPSLPPPATYWLPFLLKLDGQVLGQNQFLLESSSQGDPNPSFSLSDGVDEGLSTPVKSFLASNFMLVTLMVEHIVV
jgi:hypothetical protein